MCLYDLDPDVSTAFVSRENIGMFDIEINIAIYSIYTGDDVYEIKKLFLVCVI